MEKPQGKPGIKLRILFISCGSTPDLIKIVDVLVLQFPSISFVGNILYLIFNDNFSFARSRLNSKETIDYIESIIREILNRSFNIQIYLKSEVTSLNLQEEVTKVDKGLEILEDIVNKDILEIKDSIEK